MYAKLFRSMYDGTLASEGPWEALVTFQQLLVLADRFGSVDMTPAAISRITTIPREIIDAGLAALSQPDPESRSEEAEGRRIVPIDPSRSWGWQIVNHAYYASIRTAEERREYQRNWIKKKRASLNVDNVDPSKSTGVDVDPSDADADADADAVRDTTAAAQPKPRARARARARLDAEPEELGRLRSAYPRRSGSQPWRRAAQAAHARIADGHTWAEMIDGARRYAAYIAATGREGTEFVMQAATFLGPDKHFAQPWTPPPPQPTARPAPLSAVDRVRQATGVDLRHLPPPLREISHG